MGQKEDVFPCYISETIIFCVIIKLWKYGRESFSEFPKFPREDTHLNLAKEKKYENNKKQKKNLQGYCDE